MTTPRKRPKFERFQIMEFEIRCISLEFDETGKYKGKRIGDTVSKKLDEVPNYLEQCKAEIEAANLQKIGTGNLLPPFIPKGNPVVK